MKSRQSCVKVEVSVLGSPSLIVCTISVDVKQHWTRRTITGPNDRNGIKRQARQFFPRFLAHGKSTFESRENTTVGVAIFCPAVCSSDVMNKGGMHDQKYQTRHESNVCSLLVNSEWTLLRPEELQFVAKKYFVYVNVGRTTVGFKCNVALRPYIETVRTIRDFHTAPELW